MLEQRVHIGIDSMDGTGNNSADIYIVTENNGLYWNDRNPNYGICGHDRTENIRINWNDRNRNSGIHSAEHDQNAEYNCNVHHKIHCNKWNEQCDIDCAKRNEPVGICSSERM